MAYSNRMDWLDDEAALLHVGHSGQLSNRRVGRFSLASLHLNRGMEKLREREEVTVDIRDTVTELSCFGLLKRTTNIHVQQKRNVNGQMKKVTIKSVQETFFRGRMITRITVEEDYLFDTEGELLFCTTSFKKRTTVFGLVVSNLNNRTEERYQPTRPEAVLPSVVIKDESGWIIPSPNYTISMN